MELGRRIYYDKATGNVIQDICECAGSVMETTQEQDFESYATLADRVPETVGMLQLAFGQYTQDFNECGNNYRVDVSGTVPRLEFSYPDPSAPEAPPVYRAPLSVEVEQLREDLAERDAKFAQLDADNLTSLEAIAEVYEMVLTLQGGTPA